MLKRLCSFLAITGWCIALPSCSQATVPIGTVAKSPDGSAPAGLLDVNGTLYGTTFSGGAYYRTAGGAGTVFSLSTAGVERVLHSFGNGTDGTGPQSGLVNASGVLYGTTTYGGTYGKGTVYKISTTGSEQVLHSFGKRIDGRQPYAGLIDVNGTLYGTTRSGGGHGLGTVFSISPSGDERVLYSFGPRPDGAHPYNQLVELNGKLYGTTLEGGKNSPLSEDGGGIFFSMSLSGKERILHYFGKPGDGANPGGLVNVHGTIYGTTLGGPVYGTYAHLGTVYRVDTLGNERVIYEFRTGEGYPSSLIEANGTLYGIANAVGLHPSGGNVFRMSVNGAVHVLHEFAVYTTDGAFPTSLIDVNGELYGTTSAGGAHNAGTVFKIDPATGTEQVLYSFNPGR